MFRSHFLYSCQDLLFLFSTLLFVRRSRSFKRDILTTWDKQTYLLVSNKTSELYITPRFFSVKKQTKKNKQKKTNKNKIQNRKTSIFSYDPNILFSSPRIVFLASRAGMPPEFILVKIDIYSYL